MTHEELIQIVQALRPVVVDVVRNELSANLHPLVTGIVRRELAASKPAPASSLPLPGGLADAAATYLKGRSSLDSQQLAQHLFKLFPDLPLRAVEMYAATILRGRGWRKREVLRGGRRVRLWAHIDADTTVVQAAQPEQLLKDASFLTALADFKRGKACAGVVLTTAFIRGLVPSQTVSSACVVELMRATGWVKKKVRVGGGRLTIYAPKDADEEELSRAAGAAGKEEAGEDDGTRPA
jgi:hypothetical protein